MSRALGRDGCWHDWEDLTDEERREWMEAMTEADLVVKAHKKYGRQQSLRESMAIYEEKNRIIS